MSSKLEDRFWKTALKEVNQLGRGIDPAAETQLKRMIEQGVERMNKLGVAEDPSQVQRAQKNIVLFIREMDNENRGQGDLDIQSYQDARDICPLWPFC